MPGTFDVIDGTIQQMRDLDPEDSQDEVVDGRIWHSREKDPVTGKPILPTREAVFAWDPTPYPAEAPLYEDTDVPAYYGFAPTSHPNGSKGVWRWVNRPAGFLDAELVYGISPHATPQQNAERLQRCIDEALLSTLWRDAQGHPLDIHYHVFLPGGRTDFDQPVRLNTVGLTDNFGGRLVFKGHGVSGTTLAYVGLATEHAFLLGDPAAQYGPPGHERVIGLVLQDLRLEGTTNGDTAILRMYHAWSTHVLRNVHIVQNGTGHGIDATNIWLGLFDHVILHKGEGAAHTGTGLWMRTMLDGVQDDVFVSGEYTINRLSAFGFKTGIHFGDALLDTNDPNQTDSERLLVGIAGQFINAEDCEEGVVIGWNAVNIDLSVVWVEKNLRCGIRVYNGARDISLRRVYVLHDDHTLGDFEGEIVLGKDPAEAGINTALARRWNSYEGIDLDGVYQHKLIWPALRLWALPEAGGSGDIGGDFDPRQRDVTIRNVRTGNFVETRPLQASALIVLDDAPYESLVIENVRPNKYGGTTDDIPFVSHPARVGRLVHADVDHLGLPPYEKRRQTPVLDEVYHTPPGGLVNPPWPITLGPDAPFYHRIADGPHAVVELPTVSDRRGQELHLMKVGGIASVAIQGQTGQPINGSNGVTLTEPFAFVQLRPVTLPGGAERWEVVAQSPTGVSFA